MEGQRMNVEVLQVLCDFYKCALEGSVRPDSKPNSTGNNTERIVRDAKENKPFIRAIERLVMAEFGVDLKNERYGE